MESHHESDSKPRELKRRQKLDHTSIKLFKIAQVPRIIDHSDIIEYILKGKPFLKFSIAEQSKVIADGRPTPDLKISQASGNCIRKFKRNTYVIFSWVAGSLKLNRLFCWPCLLFSSSSNVWASAGYNDLNHFSSYARRHEQTQAHYQAVLDLSKFGSDKTETSLSTERINEITRYNEKVDQNRCVFRRLIDITCFLTKQELPFLCHDESVNTANRGNFLECVNLVSQYDGILGNHLQSDHKTIFRDVSDDTIQNSIVDAISCVIINKTKDEVNNCDFVALIVDEALDVSGSEKLCFIIRYLTGTTITQRFIGCIDVSADRNAENISELIINKLKEYNCISKLIALAYDGEAVMSSSIYDVQKKVKLQCPQALFVWYSPQVLNLVLPKSCEKVPEIRNFFHIVKSICDFFQVDTKRTEFYNQLCDRRIPRVSVTRRGNNSRTINLISSRRHNLIEFFEKITDLPDGWDGETISLSKSFLFSLRDFEFMFFIDIFDKIFNRTDKLIKIIHKETTDTESCLKEMKQFVGFMNHLSFDSIYTSAVALTREPKTKGNVADVKINYQRIFKEITDIIVSEINVRCGSINRTVLELLDYASFSQFGEKFPSQLFLKLKSLFPLFFDFNRLKNELVCVYSSSQFVEKKPLDILDFCVENKLNYAFPQLIQLASLLGTVPSRSASGKDGLGSFTTLKRIHEYLRSTHSQKSVSGLSTITIERDLLTHLKDSGTFHDDVIREFVKKEKGIYLEYVETSVNQFDQS